MDTFEWLKKWYSKQCDGVGEDDHCVDITTINNPGWQVRIELHGTAYSNLEVEWTAEENSESDWYGYKFELAVFDGIGDPSKLKFILEQFRRVIESKDWADMG